MNLNITIMEEMTREQLIERINELEAALKTEKSTSSLWYEKMVKYETSYNHLLTAFNDLMNK